MTVRPIIFSTPMVKALLAGLKTQTRRLSSSPLRRVEVGDLLYVREAFRPIHSGDPSQGAKYFASAGIDQTKWKPSIHMPRWASRLTLEVTQVKVERLRKISRADAVAEGAVKFNGLQYGAIERFSELWDSLHDKPGERWQDNPEVIALTFRVRFHNVDRMP